MDIGHSLSNWHLFFWRKPFQCRATIYICSVIIIAGIMIYCCYTIASILLIEMKTTTIFCYGVLWSHIYDFAWLIILTLVFHIYVTYYILPHVMMNAQWQLAEWHTGGWKYQKIPFNIRAISKLRIGISSHVRSLLLLNAHVALLWIEILYLPA